MMACIIARALRDGERVGVGVNSPIPAAGVLLARMTHAPQLRFRVVGVPGTIPFHGSKEFFDLASRGGLDVFFMSGVQIDAHARINLHEAAGRRFAGAFGTAVLYSVVPRVILFRTEHSPRTFVPAVDFVTAAGRPNMVVTPLAVLAPEGASGRLVLRSWHPGQTAESVQAATGFRLGLEPGAAETPPPAASELTALRDRVYPSLTAAYPRFVAAQTGGTTPAPTNGRSA